MKTIIIMLACFTGIMAHRAVSQITPTDTNPIAPGNGTNSNQYWSRAGNSNIGGTNNIFGTTYNSGIFTTTNGIYRTRLNGTSTYNINGYTGIRDGYFLLGQNASTTIGTLYGTANAGAFSLLHLSGPNPSGFAQEFGYRPWMQTGRF